MKKIIKKCSCMGGPILFTVAAFLWLAFFWWLLIMKHGLPAG